MDNRTLVQELLKKDFFDESTAKKILEDASLTKKDVEEVIIEQRLVDDKELAQTKSRLLNIPFKNVKAEEIDEKLIKKIPQETIKNYKVIPLSLENNLLVVGMVYPENPKVQNALKFIANKEGVNLGAYLITHSDFENALRRFFPYKSEVLDALQAIKIEPGKGLSPTQRITQLEEGMTVAEEAPIIKLVASTLKEAVQGNASDIHIEPERNRGRIRFRIDGDLQEVSTFPLELSQPIVSRIKVLSNLKIDETRIPQDGRFRTMLLGRDIDFRVSTFPTPMGEKVALRVLDSAVGLKGLAELGLTGRNLKVVQEGIQKPYGMILLTGPTGSGKTTTLYAIMQILNKVDVNIISLEDPVEYYIEGLNQSQVRPEIGYDFASGLRQILRQDPDIIMVGEIRDNETAGLAIHAALTGHIVLSTLHTNNAVGVIPRLIDMKVEPFLLPSAINLMVAQRIVPRLCQKCKKKETAPLEVQKIIKEEVAKLPEEVKKEIKFQEPYETYHSVGCSFCKQKGFIGRIALFEILEMTPDLEKIVTSSSTEGKILEESVRQGMITLRQDGIMKALDGMLTIEEVLRETGQI